MAEGLQAFTGTQRPLGVGLVGNQVLLVGQSGHEKLVAALSRVHGQRGFERLFVGFEVDLDHSLRRGPDMAQVGLEQAGRGLAELGENAPSPRERPGERPQGGVGAEAGEQLLTGDVAADPPPTAQEDELAKALGSGP